LNRKFQTITLDPAGVSVPPVWEVFNNGAEIVEKLNSDPGFAIGENIPKL